MTSAERVRETLDDLDFVDLDALSSPAGLHEAARLLTAWRRVFTAQLGQVPCEACERPVKAHRSVEDVVDLAVIREALTDEGLQRRILAYVEETKLDGPGKPQGWERVWGEEPVGLCVQCEDVLW